MTAAVLGGVRGRLAACKQVEVGNKTEIADNLWCNLAGSYPRNDYNAWHVRNGCIPDYRDYDRRV